MSLKTSTKRIRVGIIGTGGMGVVHAKGYLKDKNVQMVSCTDVIPQKAFEFAKQFNIAKIHNDFQLMLEDDDVDAISITTPNATHCKIICEALRRNIHVLVEKPMVIALSEADQIASALKKSTSILQIGFMWRFHPEVRFLRKILYKEYIGAITRVKSYALLEGAPGGTIGSGKGKTWFTQKYSSGGGALIDMGIHSIDLVYHLLGKPTINKINARLNTLYEDIEVEDTGIVEIEFMPNILCTIETGWFQPHLDGVEASTQLYGTHGYARLFPTSVKYKLAGTWGEFFPRDKVPHESEIPYENQIASFLEALRNNQRPAVGFDDAIMITKIVEAAYLSSKEKRAVTLSEIAKSNITILREVA